MSEVPEFPDKGQADQFAQRRVCSRCYHDLTVAPAEDRKWIAYCYTCGDAWGFTTVSRSYAEKLGQKALAESAEVKQAMPDLFPNPHKGKSAEEILKELGV